ncbi:hypothetical protein A2160_05180 [Candidatus Beckwithbacteria bacterium RBG_13_42_9]|uniref:Uncharacterized protein n=1 Tax=Candidatus Beckwithbacteria bacterium RBG_13_42_9 TaxID=1797457 RepID=A0A1F5E6I7_9BACT|nr:MAG: hypothetical protein A2160_05180 [Candidatus Beckwithbacteria bacterium RBG_13_42_9]
MDNLKPDINEGFDVAAAVGLDPQDPNYQQARIGLMAQLLAFVLAGLVETDPTLDKKVEELRNQFVEKVKNG